MSTASLDWALWRSFLAILRNGSLSAASRVLRVAHPTMRRHLDELELGLGAVLFLRLPTGLVPTETALALRASAEAMEAAAEALVRTASASLGTVAGTVRITASEVIGAEVLPPVLAPLRRRHPGLHVELVLTNSVKNLMRRDADIAVRMIRPEQADVVTRKAGTVALGLFAHRNWVDAHGSPDSLEALAAAGSLIGYDRESTLIEAFKARGITLKPQCFGVRSDSDLAQLAALRAGLGVGLCQAGIAERDPALVRVLPAFAHGLEVWIAMHPDLRGISRVRAAFDALGDGLARYAV